jgi:hypothetical protein
MVDKITFILKRLMVSIIIEKDKAISIIYIVLFISIYLFFFVYFKK